MFGNRTRLSVALLVMGMAAPVLAQEHGGRGGKAGAATEEKNWADHTGNLKFIVGWEKGKKEAEFSGKPVLYFYTTTWCGWCKKLAGESYTDAEVVKFVQENFITVLVDGDVDKDFGKEYQASGYPNTVFTDSKGKKLVQVAGYKKKDEFFEEIKSALKKNGPVRLTKAAKALAEAGADLTATREKGDWRGALKAIEAIEKIGREGAELDAAKAARTEAETLSAAKVTEAKALVAEKKFGEAKAILLKVRADFEKLPAGADAKKLLAEIVKAAEEAAGK